MITFSTPNKLKTMKKFVLLSILFVLMSVSSSADGSFVPTDTWPYTFESFRKGVIHFEPPYADLEADINICIANGHLHYLEDGVILESETKGVTGAEIDGRKYICFGKEMLEVIVEDENGYVGRISLYDPTKTGQVDIGFGISSSSFAASNVDMSFAVGLGNDFIHAKVAEMALRKGEGTPLALKSLVYIVVGENRIEPFKKDFQDLVGKDEAAAFLKENKIKWNNPETLLPVVDFIAKRK